MSKTNNMRRNIRWKLMTTVSALAISASVLGANEAQAADADRPTIWIDLGGQLEQERGFGDPYAMPFASELVADGFTSPLKAQRTLGKSIGEDAAISFQPENSSWIFSASIRYGRTGGGTTTHQQTPNNPLKLYLGTYPLTGGGSAFVPQLARYSDMRIANSESHAILDFQAGRDLGLGLFGGKSTITLGVRIAQFHSKQTLGMHADPDYYFAPNIKYGFSGHTYAVTSHIERSFHGVGPSLSWNGSAPIAGNTEDGGLAIDWGINAALLFGKQRARGHHETNGHFHTSHHLQKYHYTSTIHRSGGPDRSRSVTVPNIGGFAGISFRYADAKVSFGYRADFFLHAMDTGVDTQKSETRAFYGPFASISVGIGD